MGHASKDITMVNSMSCCVSVGFGFTSRISPTSPVRCVRFQVSGVRCQVLGVRCQVLKALKLVGGGSVINEGMLDNFVFCFFLLTNSKNNMTYTSVFLGIYWLA